MTEITDDRRLRYLPPAEARLGAAFARPKRAAVVCVLVLSGLGWCYLALAAGNDAGQGILAALCRPTATPNGTLEGFAVAGAMWGAMVFAMMLPSAAPMIFTYAEIADTAARKGQRVVSPFVLTAGYAAVWLGFAIMATAVQTASMQVGLLALAGGRPLSGALFVLAGLYQFSQLKQACLSKCQRPFPFFFTNWSTHAGDIFRLGLRQGLHCVGCCWAMMALMLGAGAMNVVWMAALGIAMTAEKMTATARLSKLFGVVLLVIGAGLVASAWMS